MKNRKEPYNIPALDGSLRLSYLSGEMTAHEVAEELYRAGWYNYVVSDEEALERIGIAALQKTLDYTPEEIAAMHDRNENFNGTQANFAKIMLYREIKGDLVEFMKQCDDVKLIDGFDPNTHEKHAVIWLDFFPAATLNSAETLALTAIMNKADGTVISAVDGHVRISFDINDIWIN